MKPLVSKVDIPISGVLGQYLGEEDPMRMCVACKASTSGTRWKAAPSANAATLAVGVAMAIAVAACTQDYDAGSQRSHGLLPVDERNPIVMLNDSESDNWQGEYAVLLANGGGPSLAGIIVCTSPNSTKIDENVAAWRALVTAARTSGMQNIPDPTSSIGVPLVRPASGSIDATVANRSEGALLIIEQSRRLSLPYRPMVVVTGGRLTDVADAYLVDPSVKDRIVVVSSVGTLTAAGAGMGDPNGEMDPWADAIVTSRLRYVQISSFYDQTTDVPASRLSELPNNSFGAWIASKQPNVWSLSKAADQVAVAAVGLPGFAVNVQRVSPSGLVAAGATVGPNLVDDPNGNIWLVREVSGTVATAAFWKILGNPKTYAN
jgi:hypothetical protein